MKKFEGFEVPIGNNVSQMDFCNAFCAQGECDNCLFDYDREETKEPFERWLKDQEHFTKDLEL